MASNADPIARPSFESTACLIFGCVVLTFHWCLIAVTLAVLVTFVPFAILAAVRAECALRTRGLPTDIDRLNAFAMAFLGSYGELAASGFVALMVATPFLCCALTIAFGRPLPGSEIFLLVPGGVFLSVFGWRAFSRWPWPSESPRGAG